MKKLLLTALLLTFAVGTVVAQQQGGPGSQGGGKGKPAHSQNGGNFGSPVERLTDLLGLDEGQIATIELIFEDSQLLREEERERARAVGEENRAITHAQILDVLTTEQQVIFEEHQQEREAMKQAFEEMRAERGYGRGGRGARDCEG
jgi:Spy/CpxP family protein refolding chaperone